MQTDSSPEIQLTVNNECCFQGAPENLLAAVRKQLTIANPKYQAAKRYSRWIGKNLKAELYFFREQESTLFFPRGFANRAVSLCRQFTGAQPRILDERRLLDPISLTFHGNLRQYQQDAVRDVIKRSFGVLEAGTGSGKTVMALDIIAERNQPTLIVVHSKELLYQWKERISEFLHTEAGQAGDNRFDLQPVTVAIVNTARKHIRELPQHFGQIIVDECHRVPANLFTDVVNGFDCFYMLGLSATAFRREDSTTQLIYTYMGDRVHTVDSNKLSQSGAIIQPDIIQKGTSFSYGFQGEYAAMIKALTENPSRNNQIAQDIAEILNQDHQGTILLVSDRIAHCEVLSRCLRQNHQIESKLLTGQIATDKRLEIIQEVKDGATKILIATMQLIGEGFDCPGLSTLIIATPIKFEGRLLQVAGRIMRPADGKKALIIDYADNNVPVLRKSAAARLQIFNRWKT